MAGQGQFKRAIASRWTSVNPVLAAGELGLETDTVKMKFGDGVTAWNSLPYANIGNQGIQGIQGAQGQGFNNVGQATLDFGNGSDQASVVITGQTNILLTSNIVLTLLAVTTSNNLLEDVLYAKMSLLPGNIVAGVGFTIYGTALTELLFGQYTIQWTWI
jgi:Major tropism determinant N-terminal domain